MLLENEKIKNGTSQLTTQQAANKCNKHVWKHRVLLVSNEHKMQKKNDLNELKILKIETSLKLCYCITLVAIMKCSQIRNDSFGICWGIRLFPFRNNS